MLRGDGAGLHTPEGADRSKEKHLHRYLAEFDFCYSNRVSLGVNDGERAALAVKNATGKRLTYRQPRQA
jgi:hypothetical protein